MQSKSLAEQLDEHDASNEWTNLFNQIRSNSAWTCTKFSTKAAKAAENVKLNRYRDVLPYDHSRVILSNSGSYINASHVGAPEACRKYILTQGPLPDTAEHFWEMVWQERSKAVIMLNKVVEKNQVKCHQYFPVSDSASENGRSLHKSLVFGDFEIRLLNETETKHYCLRTLLLLHRKVRKMGVLNVHKYGPPVIHCSAGIGRSGTFIIVDIVLVLAQQRKDDSKIDIVSLVTKLRQDRMGLIQTPDQLRFCWKAIVEALRDKENTIWHGLFEASCCDKTDAEHKQPSSPIASADRHNLDRQSANQTTDSDEDDRGDDRLSRFDDDDDDQPMVDTSSVAFGERSEEARSRRNNNEHDAVSNGLGDEDSVRQSYMARLRKRQRRAKEMQEKIEKIQAKLHHSDSSGWSKYKLWLVGGAAVLVGALLVYLYGKDWSLF